MCCWISPTSLFLLIAHLPMKKLRQQVCCGTVRNTLFFFFSGFRLSTHAFSKIFKPIFLLLLIRIRGRFSRPGHFSKGFSFVAKKIQIFGFFTEKPKKSRKRFCSVKLRLLTYSMLYQCRLLYSAAVYHCRFTWKLMPVAAVSVKLHLRHGRSNERTDAGNRIGCILALKCDIWWH